MPNVLDRIVGWVSPHAGIARHFARQQLARAYEAASPRDTWRPRRAGASANADHKADARTVRTKARALVQNVPYIRAGLEGLVSAAVGTGILPRATGREKDVLNKLFAEWSKVCDADGRFDFFGLTKAADTAMEQDGEVLVRLRWRRASDGLPVPLQLQLLEIDWLDDSKTGTYQSNTIINGIEYSPLGAVAAYWLWDQHPGEVSTVRGRAQSQRVSADVIVHLFSPERPGQGRGFSRFASVISRVRDLQLYEDAELARKNLETRLSVLASGDMTQMENPAGLGGAGEGQGARDLGDLGGGTVVGMPAGMNFTVVEPKAAPGYVDYVKYQLHLIAAGIGVPYEMLTGDMSGVNFSSARVRLLDFRRSVQQLQWLVLIPKLLEPLWGAFVEAAYLAGKVKSRDKSVDFSPPKWDYVNPEQDVKADLAEIGAGLSSISEKLRQRGYDPKVVFAELESDIKDLQGRGILDVLLFMQRGNMPTEQGAQDKPAKQV
ncbi:MULTISPECIES: phage portal protein [unclassified Massilia]|uniref:phage portal protein n=1 Tax=unclassified Massilia TaxID=2609279 RepID=UPI00177C3074|nr:MULTISPECIES: phage portal protein [unclassified Massilia]MBD8531483.1 phage portal protein [Massilia sp. CFBP 13647]MBD8673721.1 phage portal protein [Massilia sp. CFBP 13721]